MAGFAPLMRSVITSATPSTIQRLSTLLAALDVNFPTRLSFLQLEFDVGGAGNVYIGNSAVAANNCGRHLIPTSFQNILPFDTGIVLTTDIYLLADTASQQINVIALPVGM